MTADLDELRVRSDALADRLGDDGALKVNRAILAIEPGHVVATNRLGAGLMKAGRAKEALEVYEAGLLVHPDNAIMRDRIRQARHAATLPDPGPPSAGGARRKGTASAGPTAWIKALHYDDDGWTVEPGKEHWISDPGQTDADGNRVYTANGAPWGEPSWKVGDHVGLYFGGTYKVPVLVEITSPPRFDPAFVERETGSPEDAERWPWVTQIRGINAVSIESAPLLTDLGIDNRSMGRRSRKKLDGEQRERLMRLLGA
jgi:hypothetical protein